MSDTQVACKPKRTRTTIKKAREASILEVRCANPLVTFMFNYYSQFIPLWATKSKNKHNTNCVA